MAERLILPEQPTGIGRLVPGIDAGEDHVFLEVDDAVRDFTNP